MKKQFLLIFLILCLSAQSQSIRKSEPNGMVWLSPVVDLRFTPKWSWVIENQIRRADWGGSWGQYQLRTALHYRKDANNSFMLGYVFTETFPYGEDPIATKAFPEHRIYQQYQNKNMLGKAEYFNRYRLEQRFIGNSTTGTYDGGKNYKNRARYLTRINVPLTKKKFEPGAAYLAFYDELLIGFGKRVKFNVFDQNRIYVGIGYVIDKNSRIEVGYLQQTLAHSDGKIYEYNSIIQVNYSLNLLFYQPKK